MREVAWLVRLAELLDTPAWLNAFREAIRSLGGPLLLPGAAVRRAFMTQALDGVVYAVLGHEVAVARVGAPLALIQDLAAHVLGVPQATPLARGATEVERAVWAYVLADSLVRVGSNLRVYPDADALELVTHRLDGGAEVLMATEASGAAAFWVHPVVDAGWHTPLPRSPHGPLWRSLRRPVRLVLAEGALVRARAPQIGDWLVLGGTMGHGVIRLGKGAYRCAYAPGHAQVVIAGRYQPMEAAPDSHEIAAVEITAALPNVSLAELAAWQAGTILVLPQALTAPFALRIDGQVVGTCELVAVEGHLGARILTLEAGAPAAFLRSPHVDVGG